MKREKASCFGVFELKSKLEAEGLFSRKRTLPFMPKCIGIITSESGAALHDIITVARRRFPLMNFIFAHANVQEKMRRSHLLLHCGC